jgi:hypothetical protein
MRSDRPEVNGRTTTDTENFKAVEGTISGTPFKYAQFKNFKDSTPFPPEHRASLMQSMYDHLVRVPGCERVAEQEHRFMHW